MALTTPADFVEGSAEPWIGEVVCALLKASDQRNVLECGSFVGATTLRLGQTLADMGGGTLVACEIDATRALETHTKLLTVPASVEWRVVQQDILVYLGTVPNESLGLVWLDDDHEKAHVAQELEALFPKMVRGGLILGHDVWGICELHEVFERYGGYALDLPRLGPAGGLGILQVP